MNISMAWQTMRASMLTGMGKFNLFIYVLFFALVITKVVVLGTEKNFITLLAWASVPSSVFWATISSKSIGLIRDTDNFLIPNVSYAVGGSLLLQYALSVIFPSLLISLVTGHFALTLALFTFSAFCGLISTLINPFAGITMGILPYVISMFDYGKLLPDKNSNGFIISLFLGALVLALIAMWRVKLLRRTDDHYELWSTPSILAPVKGNGWDVYALNMSQHANKQSKTFAAYLNSIISLNNIISPELALRIWMGKAFMPDTTTKKIRNMAFLAIVFLGVPWLITRNISLNSDYADLKLISLASLVLCLMNLFLLLLVLVPRLFRLHVLYKNNNAELSELPLIPAWYNKNVLQDLILRIIAKDIGTVFLISTLLSHAAIFIIQPNNIGLYVVSFALNACQSLIGIGYAFRIISRQKRRGLLLGLAYCFLPVFIFFSILICTLEPTYSSFGSFSNAIFTNYLLWLFCGITCAIYFYLSHRKFRAHSHPFMGV
jgi:hypothetical protein